MTLSNFEAKTYKWGFSFLQVFICILLLLVWTIGICSMWWEAYFTMKLRSRQKDDIAGRHRAVIELAAAMQRAMELYGMETHTMSEKKLEENVKKKLRGGAISYAYATQTPQCYSVVGHGKDLIAFLKKTNIKSTLWSWIKKELWWLLSGIFLILVYVFIDVRFPSASSQYQAVLYNHLLLWISGLCSGWLIALIMGTTWSSRTLIILFWCILSALNSALVQGAQSWFRSKHASNW